MAWVNVSSSNIKRVNYDSTSNALSIEFNSGYVYEFQGVPLNVYKSFISSQSKGKFFHSFVKNKYEYKKVI